MTVYLTTDIQNHVEYSVHWTTAALSLELDQCCERYTVYTDFDLVRKTETFTPDLESLWKVIIAISSLLKALNAGDSIVVTVKVDQHPTLPSFTVYNVCPTGLRTPVEVRRTQVYRLALLRLCIERSTLESRP